MNSTAKVSELIDSNRRWQLDNFKNCLLADNTNKISCIAVPINNFDDKLIWKFSSDGEFSIKATT